MILSAINIIYGTSYIEAESDTLHCLFLQLAHACKLH